MVEKNNKHKLSLMLLREALWEVQDKIKTIIETQADHEADLIRLRNATKIILNQLKNIQLSQKNQKGGRKS